ncbi:MAG: M14 family metallopeptidase [Flavisolibacter sp.]
MLLVKNILEKKYILPPNIIVAIIPVYNIGGCLNRGSHYRVDQNGPKEFGFRGNSENLDLNRDFIKCDSKEALSFSKLFHYLDPDVFVDNHVSDGADYQPIMTLITSQHNKLGGSMGLFLHQQFDPALKVLMKQKGFDLLAYVNHSGHTPDQGWVAFWDSPRYSSGYTTLWSSFSFMAETHMLKPYPQRVAATLALEESFIEFCSSHAVHLIQLRKDTRAQQRVQSSFPLSWKLDSSLHEDILYKGYQAMYRPSEVSGLNRLYYDRGKPLDIKVPFYNTYTDTQRVQKPLAYLIPRGWWRVVERLKANKVRMSELQKDTLLEVEWYKIQKYQSSALPYEGHHMNYGIQLLKNHSMLSFHKGDYFIAMNQQANRFLIETLEPQGEDSFFTWNFFDPILRQKEGISTYHFEDIAAAFLKINPGVQASMQKRKNTDSSFAASGDAQLNYVFENSPYFEPAYLRYPVYRVIK